MNFGATMFESDKEQSFFHFDKPEPACLRNPPVFGDRVRTVCTYWALDLNSALSSCRLQPLPELSFLFT